MHVGYLTIAVRQLVVLPHSVVPLFFSRKKFIETLQEAVTQNSPVLLVTQKDSSVETPTIDDIYSVGTLARVVQILELSDGNGIKAIIEGEKRITIKEQKENDHFSEFYGDDFDTIIKDPQEVMAFRRLILEKLNSYLKLSKKSLDFLSFAEQIEDTEKMVDVIVTQLPMSIALKQEVLESVFLEKRMEVLLAYLGGEIEVFQIEKRILKRIKNSIENQQRSYVQDMRKQAIQQELGENSEYEILRERIKKTKFPKEIREKVEMVFSRLCKMSPMSSEASVERSYIECFLDLPWEKKSRLYKDLRKAEEILNKNHDGLKQPKETTIEFLAVQNRTQKMQGKVICFVGPPGVGKTSLGKAVAEATGRVFVRISLGGIRDEAELRGHRRTYVGSMPGKIIQALRKAKTTNPLILLDEIDKIGSDWRGDPASALLEILDPEQNDSFQDNYLDVGYDLSSVLFICTANTVQVIPPPLLDRMELITISGYTEDEKVQIAQHHLLPDEKKESGLREDELHIEEKALRRIIRFYCREAGVRNLHRWISTLARKAVKEIDMKKIKNLHITTENLRTYLGVPKYTRTEASPMDICGIVTGLAWTEMGGELLNIEAVLLPGKGTILSTGKLGDVMKESVQAAFSFIRSQAAMYNIDPTILETHDIHVHVPEGAVPKDGPSAGIAISVAILSVLTKTLVYKDVAMTGEISLSGKVWPIGGLKEKLLAAHQGGIKKVIIPEGNKKDLEDIPDDVKKGIEIIPVSSVDAVFPHTLVHHKRHFHNRVSCFLRRMMIRRRVSSL